MDSTPFETKCDILADLWLNYRDNTEFQDFIEYNDIGLPASYIISSGMMKPTPIAESMINETWEILLAALDTEDTGFENLDDIFDV